MQRQRQQEGGSVLTTPCALQAYCVMAPGAGGAGSQDTHAWGAGRLVCALAVRWRLMAPPRTGAQGQLSAGGMSSQQYHN